MKEHRRIGSSVSARSTSAAGLTVVVRLPLRTVVTAEFIHARGNRSRATKEVESEN